MAVHAEVLEAACRLGRSRGNWRFRPVEVVRALPHLNATTVRTHIVSRCCHNAPANHPHRYGYFRRIGRGLYEVRPAHRHAAGSKKTGRRAALSASVAETAGTYGRRAAAAPRDTVHAVVTRDHKWFVAECLEIAVVTQERTLDALVASLRQAIALHLEGEDPSKMGVVAAPRNSLTYDFATRPR